MKTTKIGIIGAGNISGAYFGCSKTFPIMEIVAVADLDVARAKAAAEKHGVAKGCSPDELLADPSIEIVINLTIPAAHFSVALAAVNAGKHVVNEKPLTVTRAQAQELLAAAKKKGVRVGGAPDTFLGSGQQTARKAIDDGLIGKPICGTAFMLCPGHESWHPSPEFYYQPGGGPMLDMGPYYMTSLINLLGPIKRIAGIAGIVKPDRTITSAPLNGKKIDVQTPDHVAGTVEFVSGAIVTVVMSFATYRGAAPAPIVIYGTQGTLHVPDPNGFDGTVRVYKLGDSDFSDVPVVHHKGYGRSAGVADLAHALRENRPHRASGDLAYAVLDSMLGFLDSSDSGTAYHPITQIQRPAPMPIGGQLGVIEG